MNKRWFALFCLPALLAAAGPAPLVTGAVRDQFGDPIAGASVFAGDDRTQTDAAGTFALETRAERVRISCDYCRTTVAPVEEDGTVVAIVERFHAIASPSLTQSDLHALPYAHAESAIALQPFTVLFESSSVLPGPRLSYYGLSQSGGLFVDDGIASYDIAAGVTPFRTLPSYDAATFTTRDPADAFRYGDLAGGGSFFVQSQEPKGAGFGAALAGSQRALIFAQSTQNFSFNGATSGDPQDARERADASVQFAAGDDALSATAVATRDDTFEAPQDVSSEMTGLRVHYDRVRNVHTYADVTADRSGYAYSSSNRGVDGDWTDLSLQTGVSSAGRIALFADGGTRVSAGYYDATGIGQARIAGTIVQTHVSAGVQSQSDRLSWRAGIGAFDISYSGGSSGFSTPNSAQILAPSVSISYALAPQWNVSADASQSFRLPSLLEEYGYGADSSAIYYDRYGTQDVTLSYSDLRRLRVSLVATNTDVSLLDNGTVSAAGASLGWQIAPGLSLRTWMLHVDDATQPYAPIFRFGVRPQPVTPASAWLTFENPHGFRADAIWRQDVLDYRADSHLDASIGAPLAGEVRWFVATERREGMRYVSAGLRLFK